MTTKKHAFYGILALVSLLGLGITQSAHATAPGAGDPFVLHFDENGIATVSVNGGPTVPDPFVIAVDPNTGVTALTYILPESIVPGVVDIFDTSGALSDAISFYNLNGSGFMAYYSTLPGTDLADTISGGFVPLGFAGPTEVGDNFTWLPGGNEYFGVSGSGQQTPDGGSTVALLGFALAGLGMLRRKLRC